MRYNLLASAALVGAILGASSAQAATNLVTNGGFEQSTYNANNQFGSGWDGFGGQGVTGWTGGNGYQVYFIAGTETSVSANNEFGDPQSHFYPTFNALSPDGGNFVALDGDQTVPAGSISQVISGLTVGETYALTFDWAAGQFVNRSGDITEQLQVSFGDQTQLTDILAVPSGGFSGWKSVTMNFTATNAIQTLNFLSLGTPTGLPPIAVLDGVSLSSAVPEPSAWLLMVAGFGGLGATLRHRRRSFVAA